MARAAALITCLALPAWHWVSSNPGQRCCEMTYMRPSYEEVPMGEGDGAVAAGAPVQRHRYRLYRYREVVAKHGRDGDTGVQVHQVLIGARGVASSPVAAQALLRAAAQPRTFPRTHRHRH